MTVAYEKSGRLLHYVLDEARYSTLTIYKFATHVIFHCVKGEIVLNNKNDLTLLDYSVVLSGICFPISVYCALFAFFNSRDCVYKLPYFIRGLFRVSDFSVPVYIILLFLFIILISLYIFNTVLKAKKLK